MKETLLITGANGKIAPALTDHLRDRYGTDKVWATDIRAPEQNLDRFEILDVLDREALDAFVEKHAITQVHHLAAILSAKGEKDPLSAWRVNMNSLFNVLEVARTHGLRVFFPSSIAVFGTHTPKFDTPQHSVLDPETVYGISKVAGENWAQYYHHKFGIDVRSLRFPGIIGYQSLPGGGTTDYAVELFHRAVQGHPYTCFLRADTRLPMLYMPDAIRAIVELMEAPAHRISVRGSYNLAGMSFTPEEVSAEIRRHIPGFKVEYKPDFRQEIADSWSASVDDREARADWGWQPDFDLPTMTRDMLEHLSERYAKSAMVQ